jgi:hypothetical protein
MILLQLPVQLSSLCLIQMLLFFFWKETPKSNQILLSPAAPPPPPAFSLPPPPRFSAHSKHSFLLLLVAASMSKAMSHGCTRVGVRSSSSLLKFLLGCIVILIAAVNPVSSRLIAFRQPNSPSQLLHAYATSFIYQLLPCQSQR